MLEAVDALVLDEPLLELGRSLSLPPWLEPHRDQIRARLPVLDLHVEPGPASNAASSADSSAELA